MGLFGPRTIFQIILTGATLLITVQIAIQLNGNYDLSGIAVCPCVLQPVRDIPVTSQPPDISFDNAFGACLIIKDDNYILPEWLAYHYHTLPMKRLIVAIDPLSETSPTAILDRYRKAGLMKITEWTEIDVMLPQEIELYKVYNSAKDLKTLYVRRQIQFYGKCMAVLKSEGISWIALIDTDEFILPNPFAADSLQLQDTKGKTVFDIISNPKNQEITPMINEGCISMHSRIFGYKENNAVDVQKLVPPGFDGSHFTTLRFPYYETPQYDGGFVYGRKCLINLNFTEPADLTFGQVNVHSPIKRICDMKYRTVVSNASSFAVNHYTGSWEQWNYRNDFRLKRNRESFDSRYYDDENYRDDTVRPWLKAFVDENGHELASYLLQGAGQFDATPPKSQK